MLPSAEQTYLLYSLIDCGVCFLHVHAMNPVVRGNFCPASGGVWWLHCALKPFTGE